MTDETPNGARWTAWKRANADKLVHPAGFEEKFVDLVLSRIPGLTPAEVVPQFGFRDNQGRPRRIDFVVLNEEKGYLLPIELDGASKDDVRPQWTDFLERQNALISSFGVVLRYSNAKMFNNSNAIVREISDHLATQAATWSLNKERMAVLSGIVGAERSTRPPAEPAKATFKRKAVAIVTLALSATVAVFSMSQGWIFSGKFYPESNISPLQAADHIGERKRVCGSVASTSEIPSGRFFNFDRRYPNQTMTVVIWRRDYEAVGKLDVSEGQNLCIEGLIQQYDGKPRIQVSDRSQISR